MFKDIMFCSVAKSTGGKTSKRLYERSREVILEKSTPVEFPMKESKVLFDNNNVFKLFVLQN